MPPRRSAITSAPGVHPEALCRHRGRGLARRAARPEQLGARQRAGSQTASRERARSLGAQVLSADATYGTAFQEYWALARLGYRLRARFSLGLEGGALGNEEYNAGRGGGFARVNFGAMEVTLSSDFTGIYLEDDPSFCVALGLYRPF